MNITVRKSTWTLVEKECFIQLYKIHRINFANYVPYFENRTLTQIKSFYYNQKFNNRQLEIKKLNNDNFQNSLLKVQSQSSDSVGQSKDLTVNEAADADNADMLDFCNIMM
ncbi:SANT/Myb_domain [Hexamita inflata]|uniref:SANT/Myb_domain n=1 Tax=Hexamita inflata TaxID=28002 RepID=A0ABP1KYC2_9EUKA